jgi:hypothetical protein
VRQPLADRYWAKVDTEGPIPSHCPELGPCWTWTASTDDLGYGQFKLDGRRRRAHKVSWLLTHGEIPDVEPRLCVLHRCDNRLCVRPTHPSLGTHLDNMRDMANKGRSTHGERSARARLTAVQVAEIRERAAREVPLDHLAAAFAVSNSTIRLVWSSCSDGQTARSRWLAA